MFAKRKANPLLASLGNLDSFGEADGGVKPGGGLWLVAPWRPSKLPLPPTAAQLAAAQAEVGRSVSSTSLGGLGGGSTTPLAATPSVSLHSWLQHLNALELSDLFHNAGFKTLRAIATADLTEKDLKRMGVSGRALRRRVLVALQEAGARLDGTPVPKVCGGLGASGAASRLGSLDLWRG